jgi:hypothetical protein
MRHGQWRAGEGVFERHYWSDMQFSAMFANAQFKKSDTYFLAREGWSDSLSQGTIPLSQR